MPPNLRRAAHVLAGAAALVAIAACSDKGSPGVPVTTTAPDASPMTIVVGRDTYELQAICYDAGAGAVVAIGSGTKPSGGEIRGIVQAVVGSGYVALRLDESTLLQPALDQRVEVRIDGTTLRAGGIAFVQDLDLVAGTSAAVAEGSAQVDCRSFRAGPPPSTVVRRPAGPPAR